LRLGDKERPDVLQEDIERAQAMGIRVVARIRPQQRHELDKDVIVSAASDDTAVHPTVVKVPNPKNESEDFSFQFSSVYDGDSNQQEIFDNEG